MKLVQGRYEFKYEMLDMDDFADLDMLKNHLMYSDEFEKLEKDRQAEIYEWCKLHATHPIVRKNLEQIRYAVTKIYFS